MAFKTIIPEMLPQGSTATKTMDGTLGAHKLASAYDTSSLDKAATPLGVTLTANRSRDTIEPGANFNDFTIGGIWDFESGVYTNQPPPTTNGTDLISGFLRVTTDDSDPVTAVFQEYNVWQAGETTGQVFTRGWHGAIGSWSNWISSDINSHNKDTSAHSILFGTKIRRRATADITYLYIDPVNGSDSNSGTSSSAPLKSFAALMNLYNSYDAGGQKELALMLFPGDYDEVLTINANPLAFRTRLMCNTAGGQINFNKGLTINNFNHPLHFMGAVFNFPLDVITTKLAINDSAVQIGALSSATIKMSGTANYGLALTNSYVYFGNTLTWNVEGLTVSSAILRLRRAGLLISGVATITGSAIGRKYDVGFSSAVDTGGKGHTGLPGSITGVVYNATGGFVS